jgi:hypothetical protein
MIEKRWLEENAVRGYCISCNDSGLLNVQGDERDGEPCDFCPTGEVRKHERDSSI